MSHARTATLALAILVMAIQPGCAPRRAPSDLQAIPHPQGKIRLTWSAVAGETDGFVVQRRTDDEPWQVIAETDTPQDPPFVDAVGPVRQQFSYRVATRKGGRLSHWSDVSTAAPTFEGQPLLGWLNVADFDTCDIPGVAAPQAIQCAIEDLGAHTHDFTGAEGPHVLYFPNGEYEVSSTLFVEGRAGIQFVGESPGGVVLRWTGRRGDGPDDPAVMFHAEGNRDATFRNLVWDGGCEDPDDCFVVAFDQSFCGRPSNRVLRSNDCAGHLDWPEVPELGITDNGGAHFDSVFRNAFVGLRLGHYGVADDTATVRRCRFVDNFAGASLEDLNALHHWFWDSTFERNYVGITNDLADVRRTFDPDYKPGRCEGQPGEPACFYSSECAAGTRCVRSSPWGGDFAVHRGRFIDNRHTDVWAQPVGEYILRDSWSRGSGRFFYAAGPNANRGSYTLLGNTVWAESGPAVVTRGPGPFLMLDNRFFTTGNEPAVVADALAGWDPTHPEAGTVDLVAVGNRFNTDRPYNFKTRYRLRELQRRGVRSADPVAIPPIPSVLDALQGKPIYTITDARSDDGVANARRIQSIIDAALSDPRPSIVHFPGVGGRFPIAETLHVPAGADLTLVGDGAFTTLWWIGSAGLPALEIDAEAARQVTVRDLQFLGAGVVVKHLDRQDGRVFLSQLRLDENDVAGLLLQELDSVRVDIADYKAGYGLVSRGDSVVGTVIDVGSREQEPRGVAVWSGDTGRNHLDYMVLNDQAGAKLLITGNYMEKSKQHLRILGNGAGGQVTLLGGKFAPAVTLVDPDDSRELKEATATVSVADFAGGLALLQSQMLVVTPAQSESHQAAFDYGSRIRVVGSAPLELDVTAVGLAVRRHPSAAEPENPMLDDPEYDFAAAGPNKVRYLRLAGVRSVPHALPLPDIDVGSGGGVSAVGPNLSGAAERRLLRSLELPRTLTPPGFYDEVGNEASPTISFDKVFVHKAKTGLVFSAGTPCFTADDCDAESAESAESVDAVITCDRKGLPIDIPGLCRAFDEGALPEE